MTERRLYFVVIALCLAAVAVMVAAVRQDQARSWRWYQAEFARRTEADLPARLGEATDERLRADLLAAADRVAAQDVALRQLYVPELGQVSRCVSCHVAATEPLAARTQFPWKRHPEPYLEAHWHPFEQYGCVVCHGGNGRATEAVAAHGEEGVGVMPRRKDEFAQAACGRCHRADEIDGAPAWNRGRYLVQDRGCAGCHDFQDAIAAASIGPTLAGLGSKTSESWLTAWLVQPEAFRPQTRMPRPRLDAREAAAVARVLAARRLPNVEAVAERMTTTRTDASRFERRGREWVEGAAGCTTCHDWPRLKRRGFHPVSGWRMIGPDLGRSGEKLTVPYVAALLDDPQSVMPGTVMPRYACAEPDRLGAAAYVVGLGAPRQRSARTVEAPPAEPSAEDRALASDAMSRLGCAACHDAASTAHARIGPALADVADRRYWQLQWSAADVSPDQRHLQRYLEWKLEGSPQIDRAEASPGVPMRMPEYRLSQHERRSVVAYLLSRTQTPMPEKFIVEAPAAVAWTLDGPFGDVNRTRRCTSCHRLGGQGGRAAPALDGTGSKFSPEGLRRYLAAPWPVDVAEQARMPHLGLTPQELNAVTRFLAEMATDRAVRDRAADAAGLTDKEMVRGESLFRGAADTATGRPVGCIACHRAAAIPGGLVGPTLGEWPSRLSAAWVYTRLRAAGPLAADSRMPAPSLGHADARALAAFLVGADVAAGDDAADAPGNGGEHD
ncbi:MAG TPA: c-type cytochrome [Phycisphaerae bacterium]|nr:c-type cytochrome [Phycisphaerae bacterium]